jgi:hypothetical protein
MHQRRNAASSRVHALAGCGRKEQDGRQLARVEQNDSLRRREREGSSASASRPHKQARMCTGSRGRNRQSIWTQHMHIVSAQ